ncbi:type II toxin-antitoxin system RelE/ParE family toxin [Patescibacteria group bacterium]
MVYNNNVTYKVKFYKDTKNYNSPVLDYIENLRDKEKAKILKYIDFLRINKGVLDEPFDFSKNRHRIFYFTFIGKNIILLHAFLKNTSKTPLSEIKKAEQNYYDVINKKDIYE